MICDAVLARNEDVHWDTRRTAYLSGIFLRVVVLQEGHTNASGDTCGNTNSKNGNDGHLSSSRHL
jgi:hypothetical protein